MLKRPAKGPKTARKKKKGNSTYALSSLDPSDDDEDKVAVEDVRVWDISTSEKTGRMTASRKTLKHYSLVSPPEEPSTSKELGGVEENPSAEDPGNLADSEIPLETAGKPKRKRKRVRVVKENDSVSESLVSPPLQPYPRFQTKMEYWRLHDRTVVLDEMLRHDGLGDAFDGLGPCPNCYGRQALFKCNDCSEGIIRCSACTVSSHRSSPLHRIEVR